MSRGRRRATAAAGGQADEALAEGMQRVWRNPALAALDARICRAEGCELTPRHGVVRVDSNGTLHIDARHHADPGEWAWALAHGLIHLGFGHVPAGTGRRVQPDQYDLAARCVVVNRFLLTFPVGREPDDLPRSYPGGEEEQLAARWRRDGIPAAYRDCGTTAHAPDQVLVPWNGTWGGSRPPDWQIAFAHALTRTMSAAWTWRVAGVRPCTMSPHVRGPGRRRSTGSSRPTPCSAGSPPA